MSAADNLGRQWEHRPADPYVDKLLSGTLKKVRYPAEMTTTLYHGTGAALRPGDVIEPGHPGNYVRRMKHAYATEDLDSARHYAYNGARGREPSVYEVRPTGPIGHRADAKGVEWATEHPLEVVRRHPMRAPK